MKPIIPKPCHEDWQQMTPAEKGRHCKACDKVVVDFTGQTPEEIMAYLKANQAQSTCGRFTSDQINHVNVQIPLQFIQKRWNPQYAFFFGLLIAFGTSLFSCKDTEGNPARIGKVEIVKDTLEKDSTKIIHKKGEVERLVGDTLIPPPPPIMKVPEVEPPPMEVMGDIPPHIEMGEAATFLNENDSVCETKETINPRRHEIVGKFISPQPNKPKEEE